MVTITLENGEGLTKTHFNNVGELIEYLNEISIIQYPHENERFLNEFRERSNEYQRNPSSAKPLLETLKRIRSKK
jgi:hypothetical protein